MTFFWNPRQAGADWYETIDEMIKIHEKYFSFGMLSKFNHRLIILRTHSSSFFI